MCKIKKDKNNSYFLAFYNSALFWPFIIFFIIILINQILFFQNNFIDYNWRYFLAFFGGLNHDLFIFSFIALILSFLSEYLPIIAPFIKGGLRGIFKLLSLIILHIFLCLPIFDYLYFNATLERFNWVVLKFINYHSTKGYIENMGGGFVILIIFLIFLIISIYFNNKKEYLTETYSFKLLSSICIFTFFASLFTNNIIFPLDSIQKENKDIVFTGDFKVSEGKNRILKNLYSGSLLSFFTNGYVAIKTTEFKPYTDKEKAFLESHGFLPTPETSLLVNERGVAIHSNNNNPLHFNKVIMIVLESFALEYIHAINPDIPAEASPYLDYLIKNYPHSKNFYTSDFPSLQGFNVLLSSKIPFNEQNHTNQKYNLASMLEAKSPNSTYFLRGSSRVYGNEEIAVKSVFGFSNLIGYEELAKNYQEPPQNTWGCEDKILYDFAFNRLKQINNNCFMVIKLLNQHQPIFLHVKNAKNQPNSVKYHVSDIVKAIYDADNLLKVFINKCEENNIIDERTLIVITADHYPPLGYGHAELIKGSKFQLGKLPLIFYSKKKEVLNNLDSEKLCCQLDVAPTLCYLLCLDIPKEHMGQNLLSPNFKARSIGILNDETLFFQSENLSFTESVTKPATTTPAIRKWINNLWINE